MIQEISVTSPRHHQLSDTDNGITEFDLFELEHEQVKREMELGTQVLKVLNLLQGISGQTGVLAMKIEADKSRIKNIKPLVKDLQRVFDKLDYIEADYVT